METDDFRKAVRSLIKKNCFPDSEPEETTTIEELVERFLASAQEQAKNSKDYDRLFKSYFPREKNSEETHISYEETRLPSSSDVSSFNSYAPFSTTSESEAESEIELDPAQIVHSIITKRRRKKFKALSKRAKELLESYLVD